MRDSLQIRPYKPSDSSAVNSLIRTIQTQEQGLDLPQPELTDIENFYQQHGNFWVAHDASELVGTAGLLLLGEGVAKLGKMFVASSHRGGSRGVAKTLLDSALSWASDQGTTLVCLETIPEPCAAQRFYLKNGFTEVMPSDLPSAFKVCPYPSRYYVRQLEDAV